MVHWLADYLANGFQWQYKYYLFFFFPLAGVFLTIIYLKTFIKKRPFYSGIPPLIRSVSGERSKMDFHNIYSQVISSAITVGMGGSARLEAPAAPLDYREITLLLAFSILAFIPLLMSSAVAFVISKMMHSAPMFIYLTDSWQTQNFWMYVLFGMVAGFYSIFYSYVNESVPKVLSRINGRYNRALSGGLVLGLLVTLFPAIYGEGYIAIQQLLDGNYKSLLANSLFPQYQDYAWVIILFGIFSLIRKTYGCVITYE